jgi:hypothetical protein
MLMWVLVVELKPGVFDSGWCKSKCKCKELPAASRL